MAETRISKIRHRQGNFSDLPVLDPGELGYAKDVRRLFIGNDTVSVGTGNGVLTSFTVPLALSKPCNRKVFVDGVEENAANYSISGTTATYKQDNDLKREISLSASMNYEKYIFENSQIGFAYYGLLSSQNTLSLGGNAFYKMNF